MNEKLHKYCETHDTNAIVKLTPNKSEKLTYISMNVSGDCGCNFGNVEAELVL